MKLATYNIWILSVLTSRTAFSVSILGFTFASTEAFNTYLASFASRSVFLFFFFVEFFPCNFAALSTFTKAR